MNPNSHINMNSRLDKMSRRLRAQIASLDVLQELSDKVKLYAKVDIFNPIIMSRFVNLIGVHEVDDNRIELSLVNACFGNVRKSYSVDRCFKEVRKIRSFEYEFVLVSADEKYPQISADPRLFKKNRNPHGVYLCRITDTGMNKSIIAGGFSRKEALRSCKMMMIEWYENPFVEEILYSHLTRISQHNAWNLSRNAIARVDDDFSCIYCGVAIDEKRAGYTCASIRLMHEEFSKECPFVKHSSQKPFTVVPHIYKKYHKKDVQKQKYSSPKHIMNRERKRCNQAVKEAYLQRESREVQGNEVTPHGKVKKERPQKYAHLCKHEWSFIQPKMDCEPEKFICFDPNYYQFLIRKANAAEADVDAALRDFDISKAVAFKALCAKWMKANQTLEEYKFKHRTYANEVEKQSLFSVTVEHRIPMLDEVTKILGDVTPKSGSLAASTFACANFIIDMWQAFQTKSLFDAVRKAIGFLLSVGLPTNLISSLTQYLLDQGKKLFSTGNQVTAHGVLSEMVEEFEIDSAGVITLTSIIFTIVSAVCLKNLPGPNNVDTFMRRCDLLPKCAKGISDLFEFITKIIKKSWSHITGEVVEGEFDDPDKLPKCMEEITDKITQLDIKYVQRKTAMDINIVQEIHELYDQHAVISKALLNKKGLSMKINSFWTSQALKLVKLKQLADISGAEFKKTRTQPIVLQFYGKPGQGKTESVKYFQLAILKFLGKLNHETLSEDVMRDQEVFYRQICNEYWDGYSNQTIVCYDDFGTMKDIPNKPNEEFLELIHIAGAAPYSLHMSDVKDKANTYFDTPIVMLTSNRMNYKVESITNPEALTRRVTARIHVEAKDKYCKTIVDGDGKPQRVIDPMICWSSGIPGGVDFDAWEFSVVDERAEIMTITDFDDNQIYASKLDFYKVAEYLCTLADVALTRRGNENTQIKNTVKMFDIDRRFNFLTRSKYRQEYVPVEIIKNLDQNMENVNKCIAFMFKDRPLTAFGPGSIAITEEKLEQLALDNTSLLTPDYLVKVAETFDIRIDIAFNWSSSVKPVSINKDKQMFSNFVIGFQNGFVTLLERKVPKHVSLYDEVVGDVKVAGNEVQPHMLGLGAIAEEITQSVNLFVRRFTSSYEEVNEYFANHDEETRKMVLEGPLDDGQLKELDRLAHRDNLNRHMAHVLSVQETHIERLSAPFRNFWRVYRSRLLVPRAHTYKFFSQLIDKCNGCILKMQEQMSAMRMEAWDYFDHVSEYSQQVGKSLFKDLKDYMLDVINNIPYKTICTTLLVCAAAVPVLYTMYKVSSKVFAGPKPRPAIKRDRKQVLANLKKRIEDKIKKDNKFEQFQLPIDFMQWFINVQAEEDPQWYVEHFSEDEVTFTDDGFVESKPTNTPSVPPKRYVGESKPSNTPSVPPQRYVGESKPSNTPSVPPKRYGILKSISNTVTTLAGKMFRDKRAPPIKDALKSDVFEDLYTNVYPDENTQIDEVTKFCQEEVDQSLQFCKDFGAEALLKNIIPSNMYYISGIDEKTGEEFRLLQGTFLKGRYLLTNAHVLEAASTFKTFHFTSMFSTKSFSVPIKELKFKYVKQYIPSCAVDVQWGEEYKDAIIILMPNSVPQHRDITRHFLSRKDQNQFQSARAMYVCVNEIGNQPMLVARAGHVTSADVNWSKPLDQQMVKYGGMDVPPHITFRYDILASLAEQKDVVKELWLPDFWFSKTMKTVSTVTRDYYWTADIDSVGGDCGSLLVITEPGVNKKIAGMHFAGQKVGGLIRNYCMALTREDFEETFWDESAGQSPEVSREIDFKPAGLVVKGFDYSKMGVVLDVDRAGTSNAIPKDGVHLLGTVKPVFRAKTSRIRPSAIHGTFEPITKPANLKPIKVGDEVVDPLALGLKKITPPPVCVESDVVVRVAREIFDNVIYQQKPDSQYTRVLTHAEAITGVEGVPYLESMKRQTSAGYPWTQNQEYQGEMEGKNKWLGSGDEFIVDDPNLKRACEQRIEAGEKGKRYPTVWTDTLKDERRPIAKVDAGKTRVFVAGPMDFTLVFRQYFLGFMAQIMTDRVLNGVAVGIDPTGCDWDGLARKLKSMGPCVIAGDFENFDGTLLSQLLIQACYEINRWYKEHDSNWKIEDDNVRIALIHEVTNSIHVCENSLYMWTHGLTSGCPITAILNSIYNLMVCYLAWLRIMEKVKPEFANIKCYVDNVYTIAYGDDNVLNISRRVIDIFNMGTISDAFSSFGMKYTDEAKTGVFNEFKSLSEVAFLKRGFVWRYGKYEAPLDAGVVKEMTNWVHGDVNKILNTNLNIETALAEACLHDKEFYEDFQLCLRSAVSSIPYYSPQPVWQSYEGMRKAVFNKYYQLGQ